MSASSQFKSKFGIVALSSWLVLSASAPDAWAFAGFGEHRKKNADANATQEPSTATAATSPATDAQASPSPNTTINSAPAEAPAQDLKPMVQPTEPAALPSVTEADASTASDADAKAKTRGAAFAVIGKLGLFTSKKSNAKDAANAKESNAVNKDSEPKPADDAPIQPVAPPAVSAPLGSPAITDAEAPVQSAKESTSPKAEGKLTKFFGKKSTRKQESSAPSEQVESSSAVHDEGDLQAKPVEKTLPKVVDDTPSQPAAAPSSTTTIAAPVVSPPAADSPVQPVQEIATPKSESTMSRLFGKKSTKKQEASASSEPVESSSGAHEQGDLQVKPIDKPLPKIVDDRPSQSAVEPTSRSTLTVVAPSADASAADDAEAPALPKSESTMTKLFGKKSIKKQEPVQSSEQVEPKDSPNMSTESGGQADEKNVGAESAGKNKGPDAASADHFGRLGGENDGESLPAKSFESTAEERLENKGRRIDKHMQAGDMFLERRDLTNALLEFEEVIKLDPKSFKGHYMLAKVLLGMSDFEEALKEADEIVAIRATSGDAHFMRGEALRLLGKYSEASDEYNDTLHIDHGNALAHAYLAECLRKKEAYKTAIAECRKAIKLNERLVVPHLIMAQCYAADHNADDALTEYKTALALDPKDPVVHARYGLALGNAGKWDAALLEFRHSTDLNPRYSEGHLGLSWTLANINRVAEAVKEAKLAVSLAPNDPDTHSNLAWVYSKKLAHADAVTEYRLAVKIAPTNAKLHRALGLALRDMGDINGAIAELLVTTKMSPKDMDSKLALQSLMQGKRAN